ncbi:MAG: DUF4105 domain-containing protein [Inquilinus sp.]|nr:DUF4105 domain-containing protein [Inquilinus sp.]
MAGKRRRRFRRIARRVSHAGMLAVAVFVPLLLLRAPTHDKDWAREHALLPSVAFDGDMATVRNVRKFRYRGDGTIAAAVYEDRAYDLSRLTSVWYGITHFSKFDGLAHTFLSFGFADGAYLALSIEARRTGGETYSPARGLFRNYELIYVLGDERDVIGLRSHVQGHRVQLYPIRIAPELGAELLRAMLIEADEINRRPRFYNTLIDNCTTGIAKHATPMPAWRRVFDYRIVFPGFSDRLVHNLGLLEPGVSLDEARRRATIDPAAAPLAGEGFSTRLRKTLG